MSILKNAIKHFNLVSRHRFVVFKLSKTSIKETLDKNYLKDTYINIAKKYNINVIE